MKKQPIIGNIVTAAMSIGSIRTIVFLSRTIHGELRNSKSGKRKRNHFGRFERLARLDRCDRWIQDWKSGDREIVKGNCERSVSGHQGIRIQVRFLMLCLTFWLAGTLPADTPILW